MNRTKIKNSQMSYTIKDLPGGKCYLEIYNSDSEIMFETECLTRQVAEIYIDELSKFKENHGKDIRADKYKHKDVRI